MDKVKTIHLRTLAEAHLYVAVVKADGRISYKEKNTVSYFARKSQEMFNIMGSNITVQTTIGENIKSICNEGRYEEWDSGMHINEAVRLLKKAKQSGDWTAQLSDEKNEEGLEQVARSDGYTYKESKILRQIKSRLAILD